MSIYQYLSSRVHSHIPQVEEGDILVAMPLSPDLYFNKTVIVITRCTEDACIGLIVNRKSDSCLEIKTEESTELLRFPLYMGGPVANDVVHMLYHGNYGTEALDALQQGVYVGMVNDGILSLLQSIPVVGEQSHLYLGVCTWLPEQLEQELREGCWGVVKQHTHIIFSVEADKLWNELSVQVAMSNDCRVLLPNNPQDN